MNKENLVKNVGIISCFILLYFVNIKSITALTKIDSTSIYFSEINSLIQKGKAAEALSLMIETEEYIFNQDFESEQVSTYFIQLCILPLDIKSIENSDSISNFELGRAYEYYTSGLFLKGTVDSIEHNYLKSLELLEEYNEAYRIHKWLALFYSITEQSNKSIVSYNKAIATVSDKYAEGSVKNKKIKLILHSNVLSILIQLGNFTAAKKHVQKALTYAIELKNDYYTTLAYINQGTLYAASNDPDNALAALKNVGSNIDNFQSLKTNYYNLKATAHFMKEEYDLSKKYYRASINEVKSNTAYQTSALINQAAIANIIYLQKNYEESIAVYDSVVNVYLQYPDKFASSLPEVYSHRSRVHLALGQIDDAYRDIQSALAIRGDYKNWKIRQYANLSSVYAAYFSKNNQVQYADSVLWNLNRTENYIDSIRNENRYLDSEATLNTFLYDAYAENLESLFEIYKERKDLVELNKIFQYFEKIKSYSIKEYLKTDDAFNEGKIPKDILEEERNFKSGIASLKKQLYINNGAADSNEKQSTISNEINKLESKYILFLKELEKEYPNYFTFQYQQYETNLEEVQKELSPTEMIVEYYMAPDAIYTFVVQHNSCQFLKLEIDQEWKKDLKLFLETLTAPAKNDNALVQSDEKIKFIEHSKNLYNDLLREIINELPSKIKHITIVGDNQLNFIPFEVLLTKQDEYSAGFKDLSYLINDFSISYDSSVSDFMRDRKAKRKVAKLKYIGYAPTYTGGIVDLPYSLKSVKEIASLYKGKIYTKEETTVNKIKESSKDGDILHFAMHGVINQLYPSLSHFKLSSNEKDNLYLSDIYNYKLNASLAILSACNTGIGKYLQGDGVQNISRAFRFAGVSSTLMSLWSVPDVQTAKMDIAFLNNIEQGYRKDEALRLAKLDYLENAPQAYQHPFYWAGFIPVGNMEKLSSSFVSKNLSIFILTALIILCVAILNRKRFS